MEVTQKRKIVRINEAGCQQVEDVLLKEAAYQFFVNGKAVMEFHCIPENLEQLAIGHALCKDWLNDVSQIKELIVRNSEKQIHLILKEGISPKSTLSKAEDTVFDSAQIHTLCEEFEKKCDLFRLTGASHSCGLADKEEIRIYMNDVARHNSLDKVIGEMFLKQENPAGKAFIFSGRLALDMIEKAIKSGVKILVAPGAPTLAAVELAEKNDLTLLGFVRRDNINIYTNPHRIC